MDIYELARGPLAWISFLIFIFGSLYRVASLLYSGKSEPVLDKYREYKDAARSILHGIIPFSSIIMRRQPFFAVVTFTFHISVARWLIKQGSFTFIGFEWVIGRDFLT